MGGGEAISILSVEILLRSKASGVRICLRTRCFFASISYSNSFQKIKKTYRNLEKRDTEGKSFVFDEAATVRVRADLGAARKLGPETDPE